MIDETWVTKPIVPIDAGGVFTTAGPMVAYVSQPAGIGFTVSYWIPTALAFVLGTLPWLPGRVRLRTLLIGMTVTAVVLGLIIALKLENPKPIDVEITH
jgi:hypothetical protein